MRRAGFLLVVAIGLASCGIPLDDEPLVIAAEDLPATLQPPEATTTTSTTTLAPGPTEELLIYLVDPGEGTSVLEAIPREVALADGGVDPVRTALEELLLGPTNEEQLELNLTTFLVPSGDDAIEVIDIRSPVDQQLSIVLSEPPAIEGAERTTAFAQMVYTLTEFENVDRVQFLVRNEAGDDEFIAVKTLTEEGDVTRPVDRSDYVDLGPEGNPGS